MIGGVCIVVILVVDFNGFKDFGVYVSCNVYKVMVCECVDCDCVGRGLLGLKL